MIVLNINKYFKTLQVILIDVHFRNWTIVQHIFGKVTNYIVVKIIPIFKNTPLLSMIYNKFVLYIGKLGYFAAIHEKNTS